MRIILISLFIWIGLTPIAVFAQHTSAQDTLLDHLTGQWVLQGTIAGEATTHDIDAAWVLDHQYLQLKEVSREKELNGKPMYEAIVYIAWEQKAEQYSCLWLDVTGNWGLSAAAIGHAKANNDTIGFLFNDAGGSVFHTIFTYTRQADCWQWTMDSEENGQLQSFARVKLTRK